MTGLPKELTKPSHVTTPTRYQQTAGTLAPGCSSEDIPVSIRVVSHPQLSMFAGHHSQNTQEPVEGFESGGPVGCFRRLIFSFPCADFYLF